MIKKIINKLQREWREWNPLFWLPTDQKLVLFESTSDFCDNSKALYDELLKQTGVEKLKLVWMVEHPEKFTEHKKSNVKFVYYSDRTMSFKDKLNYWYYNAKAGYCFYTHKPLGCYYKKSQVRCFLTHGTPLKDSRGKFWKVAYNTHIVSTSDFAADLRCKAFLGGRDKVLLTGFPRNDLLINGGDDAKKTFGLERFDKIVLWMPTFKHIDVTNVDRKDMETELDMSILDNSFIQDLNRLLQELNMLLIIKYHPHQDMRYVPQCELTNIWTWTNQKLREENVEVYSLLACSDALITDFSSVYLDYLVTNRPIGFELNDLKSYSNGVGFLVDDPLSYMPGHKIRDKHSFEVFLRDIQQERDPFKKEREVLCRKFHDHMDGNSAKRLLKYFKLL
ncbi:CDP-glycerol glycerophosphotransferase family protein [Bariatricus sp. HCP28S3_A7]|uniref:CDP-glycerol glycerophosphotransferase family protein n=1 Tax=Bariatricus sp. HCP28S3_A7 TaxID=3438894 RepID=UPI003F886233